ncbi:glycosyltransferase [Mesorhizobium sp. BR1-1-16]|uniref:glycosyltransferase family 2 protein n=1 Tax=Mesorhizobium sp. BR1-1-16 TaxID=2876653 RepID=UPI001CCB632A|nr:glycosyltransferase family 2 protein [Mesorhizobium sp. BR1-1-16]MBZ9935967.1 glycosyltransferase [Mesorhizobium sp. BR1-1-16]
MNFREQWLAPGSGTSLERRRPETGQSLTARAAALGLSFDPRPERNGFRAEANSHGDIDEISAAIRAGRAVTAVRNGEARLFFAPDARDFQLLAARIAEQPGLRDRISITTPAAIRRLLLAANQKPLVAHAINALQRLRPDLSARRLLTRPQIVVLAVLLLGIAAAIFLTGWVAIAVLDILAGLLFLGVILIRMQAITGVAHRARQRPAELPDTDPAKLPIYSVLLPLHHEAHMVADLVAAMDQLAWPREKLDIKLIVEADDRATIAAIIALQLAAPFELIRVPPSGPRTKPKALAYALPLVRGDYVTVYDAEDRPDPLQLAEAHAAFAAGGPDLACLQAPLLIDNADANGLTALFALEYSVQFDGVLPLLATFDLPLPLGGTSNHFRRAALEWIGGWDPYNVTEDADLGVRLVRFGYRAAMLERPTYEEAPATVKSWLAQRTRWLKGWMQTVLVHLRAPQRLLREIGPKRFAGFMLTSLGSLVAAAVHPLYIATALMMLVDPARLWRANSPLLAGMAFLNLFNLVAAYFVFALLSRQTYRLRRQNRPAGALIYLPAYWVLLSIACYRALFELIIAPHHWAKTRHVGRRRRGRSPTA